MEQTFERVRDPNGEPIPRLYVRRYQTTNGSKATRYYAIFTDWKGIRRREPLSEDLKRAKNALGDLNRKNDAEFDFDEAKSRRVTLSQWAAECKNAMRERDFSLLTHLEATFGSTLLSRITEKEIIDYRATRAGETVIRRGKPSKKLTSPTTVNKEVGLLRKLMRLAQTKGIIGRVPKFKVEKERSRDRVLSEEEYAALLANCPLWLKRVCVAAYETCLTRGDLLNLIWDEVDRKSWVIKLADGREKTKVRQEIPIRTEALTALFRELEGEYRKLPNVDGLVFTCGGQRIEKMQLRRALQRACKAARIDGFTFHDFRHCAITRWHAMNVPVSVAMRMAGHSSVQAHKKYVNLGTKDLIEVFTSCLQRNSEPTKSAASA